MTANDTNNVMLQNGVQMPYLGLGVWKVTDEVAENTVRQAIEVGYRAIDTAVSYGNEAGVGRGIATSGVNRDQIFVTTKIWNGHQGYHEALAAFDDSRSKLNMDVVDLLLIHWPVKEKYTETWRALEDIYAKGYARSIGVSNFQIHHLENLATKSEITPMVNQIEFHPLLTQEPLRQYCSEHNIGVTAWSPLMQGNLDIPLLKEIAAKHNKSAAQIVLRWDIQNGVITIPKTTSTARLIENADVFDFELTSDEMTQISALNENKRFGPDPDNFNF